MAHMKNNNEKWNLVPAIRKIKTCPDVDPALTWSYDSYRVLHVRVTWGLCTPDVYLPAGPEKDCSSVPGEAEGET